MLLNKHVLNTLESIKDDKSIILGLAIGSKNIVPGQRVPKADIKGPPLLSFRASTGTYIAISLDLDPPFPSFNVLGPILHWIQPGLQPEVATTSEAKLVAGNTPFIADFLDPSPPPGSKPHRYVFLLYEQPPDFDIAKYAPAGGTKFGIMKRMRYNLEAFEKEARLGKILACNFFLSN